MQSLVHATEVEELQINHNRMKAKAKSLLGDLKEAKERIVQLEVALAQANASTEPAGECVSSVSAVAMALQAFYTTVAEGLARTVDPRAGVGVEGDVEVTLPPVDFTAQALDADSVKTALEALWQAVARQLTKVWGVCA
jgi:hypothetical protein